MNTNPTINPRVIQVIQKQVTELIKKAPEGIQYVLNESDILDIQADIYGPVGTPYAGGAFRCKLVLSSEFPRVPPKGFFLTKIFHPNISEKGEICVNTLKKDWEPTNWSLQHVFEVIRCLLIVPFPESALNEEAGKVFMEDYEEYAKHARLITELYAFSNNRFVQPLSMSQKAVEKPKVGMDISFENTQDDSPVKQNPFHSEKEKSADNNHNNNFLGSIFKTDRSDEVLMPVTNSLHANTSMSPLEEVPFKKTGSLPAGSIIGTGIGIQVSMNGNSMSAKKENDDKKKWRKRI